MTLNNVPAGGIAAAVWTQATRNLTSLGAGAAVLIGVTNTSLAANAAIDIRPAAGKYRQVSIGVAAGAAGSTLIRSWDGVTTRTLITVASSTAGGVAEFSGSPTVGCRIDNADASNAASYQYGGVDWTQ